MGHLGEVRYYIRVVGSPGNLLMNCTEPRCTDVLWRDKKKEEIEKEDDERVACWTVRISAGRNWIQIRFDTRVWQRLTAHNHFLESQFRHREDQNI